MIIFYYQAKTLSDFWYRGELNLNSLIWLQEILLIKLTRTNYI